MERLEVVGKKTRTEAERWVRVPQLPQGVGRDDDFDSQTGGGLTEPDPFIELTSNRGSLEYGLRQGSGGATVAGDFDMSTHGELG